MSWIDSITNIFIHKNIHISKKISLGLIIIVTLLLINDYVGFTYYRNIENKASALEKLNRMIVDKDVDSITKMYLTKMRTDVLSRKTAIESSYEYLTSLSFGGSENRTETTIASNERKKYDFWFFLSSSIIFVSMIIAINAAFLFGKFEDQSILQRIGLSLGLSFAIGTMGFIINLVCYSIPVIDDNNMVYNYIINAVIQLLSIGIPVYWDKIKRKNSQPR